MKPFDEGDSTVLCARGVTPAEWDALAERSRNIFATREWLGTWHRHEPPMNGAFTLVTRGSDGALAALLPLTIHRRRPTVLRPLGPWPPPDRPLICAPEDEAWAVRHMSEQLVLRGGWDVLEMDAVPSDQPWCDRLPGVALTNEPSTVIDLAGVTWDELLERATRNSRRDIRRRERRLHERYSVRFRRAEEDVHADLDLFLKLHWARWGKDVNVLTPERSPIIHDFVEQAFRRGWLALWVMELDGQPVAADLNFRYCGREVAFLSGRDPTARAEYVGLALMFHTIRQAAADGITEFELLRGSHPFKARLPHRIRLVNHLALSGSRSGRLTIAARSTGRKVERVMRAHSHHPRRLVRYLRRSRDTSA